MWCFAYPEATAGFLSVAPSGDLLLSFPKFDIIALNIFAGVGWAGLGLAQLNLMIGLSPRETRSSYLAAISASVGVAGGLSPLIGGALMHSFAHLHYPVHGLIKNNYHVVFMISAFLRLFAFYPLGKLYEERSRTTRYVLGQLRASPPIASITALHRLSKPADSTSRMQAAKDLGKMRAPVAVEDLVKALDDVSLTVREQAATSLGEIGDDRAVGPLMDKLTDPASGITMEAATALGNIGHRAALPALAAAMEIEGPQARKTAAMAALGKLRDARVPHILVRFVGDPDPGMRASAVRALSIRDEHVASPDVKAAIMAQWKIEDDPTIQALLIEAIARTGGADLVPGLIDDIPRITSPAIKREILNAIGSLVAGPESFYVYLMLDQFARDEAVSKILGALCRKFRALGVAGAARLTARMRQAQRCFTSGDYTVCVNRLAHAAELLASGMAGQEIAECQALNVAVRLAASFAEADADEALLLVFLLKTAVG
jgi:HEAT repeat protein